MGNNLPPYKNPSLMPEKLSLGLNPKHVSNFADEFIPEYNRQRQMAMEYRY